METPQRLHDARDARMQLRAERDTGMNALYPHARTFTLVNADVIGATRHAAARTDQVPATLTLVTPRHADPAEDHLFVGPHPVLRRDLRWEPDFEELSFSSTAGAEPISGHLRLTHSRTRAFGVLHFAGVDVSVQYSLAPQRYLMKLGRGAAYVSTGTGNPVIAWNTDSPQWRGANWPEGHQLGFTFGPEALGTFSEEAPSALMVRFDDIASKKVWEPSPAVSSCTINGRAELQFQLMRGAKPPKSSDESDLFPYQLRIQLSTFGESFVGGMLSEKDDVNGAPYGLQGEWDGGHVAGAYRLRIGGRPVVVGVHHRELYVGERRIPGTELVGNRLRWTHLPAEVAAATGLPVHGHLDFSADGWSVADSSFGAMGNRVSPDEAHGAGHRRGAAVAGPPYTITDLNRMTQYAVDANHLYYDEIQQQSMDDFYSILQHDMDQNLRRKFLSPHLKPMSPAVAAIAKKRGGKGTDPKTWYESLGIAYTAQTLAKWSEDPQADLLNGARAGAWLTRQTETSDVMSVQAPLLYQNRYVEKYREQLDWFLLDQQDPDKRDEQHRYIDQEVAKWIREIDADLVGAPDELEKIKERVRTFGARAKERELYWAFRLYVQASQPAYLNLLQSILEDPTNDGSSFTQQVQRTVALLGVLDPSNLVCEQYAYTLQLFEVGSLLPQLADYGNDIDGFNFAVRQIVDAFIKTYLNSPDPQLREAAEQLQRDANADTINVIMECLRSAATVNTGLYNWAIVAERFETKVGKVLGKLPGIVAKGVLLAAVGLLINFCVQGNVQWEDIPEQEQYVIISAGVGILAQGVVYLVKRGVAVSELFIPGQRFGQTFKLFFSGKLLTDAAAGNATGFRGWLLGTNGRTLTLNRLQWRAAWAAQQGMAVEAARLGREITRQKALTFVFGRNMREFVATRIGAALAISGIVMSAIALHNSDEPIDKAVNSLFLIASALEFIAVAGAWGLAFAGISTIGGLAVGTILAAVSVVGLVVLVAGLILLLVMMFQPQKSPLEKFAEESGSFYMPHKAAIDSFEMYQPLSQAQRAGLAVLADGHRRVLRIDGDGAVRQAPLDATGNTAFYARVDELGRVQIGAPIRDTKNKKVLFALSTDDSGRVTSTNAVGDAANQDSKLLWIAEIQDDGRYETDADGKRQLHSAQFKIYSAYWEAKGQRRYLTPDGEAGWRLGPDGAVLTLEVVSTAPQGLQMSNIIWYTYQHDERRSPALDLPGSLPHTWSVQPALPHGITLDTATGAISMDRGVDMAPLPAREYELVVSNGIGEARARFSLLILEPAPELVPALVPA